MVGQGFIPGLYLTRSAPFAERQRALIPRRLGVFGAVGRRFIAGTTNRKKNYQIGYATARSRLGSRCNSHSNPFYACPRACTSAHFGMVGQGFIPDPLRAVCGAVKGFIPDPLRALCGAVKGFIADPLHGVSRSGCQTHIKIVHSCTRQTRARLLRPIHQIALVLHNLDRTQPHSTPLQSVLDALCNQGMASVMPQNHPKKSGIGVRDEVALKPNRWTAEPTPHQLQWTRHLRRTPQW